MDSNFSRQIGLQIRNAIGNKPLLVKIGHYKTTEEMRRLLRALSGIANGITLVNAISRPVLHRDGKPAFGEKFVWAGVLGRAIHEPCVQSARDAATVIRDDKLSLSIAAVGGISTERDADDFFRAGAGAVLMGSSPMYLPHLAAELKHARPEW